MRCTAVSGLERKESSQIPWSGSTDNVEFSISKIPAKILSYLQPILLNNMEISVMCVFLWVWTISGYFPTDIINLLFFQHNFVSSFYYFFFSSSS